MHFSLVDAVLERTPHRIVTLKQVTAAEEYLQDHFPGFPVLPGVMMLEAMVQAGRALLADENRLVLGRVRALKYGRFVKPGSSLRVEVESLGRADQHGFDLKGRATIVSPDPGENGHTAVSGRFTLRPIRLGDSVSGA